LANADGHALSRRLDAKAIAAVLRQEGRNIEGLGTGLPDSPLPLRDGQHIAMPLLVGVVHFVDQGLKPPIRAMTEPDAERVENIAEDAGIAEDAQRTAAGNTGGRQLRVDPLPQ